MKIQTATLSPNLDPHTKHQVYNGLDCCLTYEIYEVLADTLQTRNEPWQRLVYDFERGMQAPALEMMERGWLIDASERAQGIFLIDGQKKKLEALLNRYGEAIWGKGINANSPAQLKKLFYEVMGLPEQYKVEKGQRKVSTGREALESLQVYFYAMPLINCILAIREDGKLLSVLQTEISRDGRMRTSYNVAGTETGRWSSSSSADGSGTNLQNITPRLRRMFVADPGYKLCYLDLEQAESRVVGLLVWKYLGESAYLDACEGGDLHTSVAKLVWPSRNWTGDLKQDKSLAEEIFYRHFSYRDMAKRGGHGTNYFGTPRTMAGHLKVESKIMQEFQINYCGTHERPGGAFPGIRKWHYYVREELQSNRSITTLLGRKRTFFGRPNDDSTLREAIAFEPQSVVGDLLNTALWRVWKHEPRVQLLGQIHDAIVFQYPDDPKTEVEIIDRCLELTRIPITARGRTMTIPSECKIGWNWAERDDTKKKFKDGNPNGLVKYKGQPDGRRRVG